MAIEHQESGPATRARIATAGAVGVEGYFLSCHVSLGL